MGRLTRAFVVLLGAAPLVLAAGCRSSTPAAVEVPPPEVSVTQPIKRALAEHRDFTGRAEAVESVDVRARVKGYLSKISFREGTPVKRSDLLYEIDPRTFQADLDRTLAEVARLEALVKLAAAEADRAQRLRVSGAMSEEELVQRVTARNGAQASLQQARAAAESARLELSFTRITAPIDGRIGRTLVTEGNLVGHNEPTLLTSIVKLEPIYVYFEGSERDLRDYEEMMQTRSGVPGGDQVPVRVGLAGADGYPLQGVIDFCDNRLDQGSGTILLRAVLPNRDRTLTPGQFVRVRVPMTEARQQLLLPEQTLAADQRGRYVLVVNAEGIVEHRPVTVGSIQDGLVVIKSGLSPDDRVVVNGLQRARRGAKVMPREVAATGLPAESKK